MVKYLHFLPLAVLNLMVGLISVSKQILFPNDEREVSVIQRLQNARYNLP